MPIPNLPRGGRSATLVAALCLLCWTSSAVASATAVTDSNPPDEPLSGGSTESNPAHRIVHAVDDESLRAFLVEVLERNPEMLALRAQIDALSQRPAQARALPDPMLQSSLFALPPETRVGPQRLQVGLQQRLPSKVRRELRADDARLAARSAESELHAAELRLLTRARELWLELAFIDTLREILHEERGHLERHEEAARARYAAGAGLAQGPIKIQAELTRVDAEILGVDARRRGLLARLDALRDRFDEPFPEAALPAVQMPMPGPIYALLEGTPEADRLSALVNIALAARPEIGTAHAMEEKAEIGEKLAETRRKPDFTVGLAWTLVENRQDDAGRLNPPEDNGRDVLALVGGMTLPLWKAPREAELEEALARSRAADAGTRGIAAEIRRQVTDLVYRLPLETRQLRLLRDVLERQAEEAVTSVVTAYSTGQTGALDLLDAEHRLFEVRRAVARAQTDAAIALVQLEGALATPLDSLRSESAPNPETRHD